MKTPLYFDIKQSGLKVLQVTLCRLFTKSVKMEVGYRNDNVVESKVLIEVKSVETLPPFIMLKSLTYLKLSG